MQIAPIARYVAEFICLVIALLVAWLWLQTMRWGFADGRIVPPTMISPWVLRDRDRPQGRFTFWTYAAYWTVLAGGVEALVIVEFWTQLTKPA